MAAVAEKQPFPVFTAVSLTLPAGFCNEWRDKLCYLGAFAIGTNRILFIMLGNAQ